MSTSHRLAATVAVFGVLLATPPLITQGAALPIPVPQATMNCQESGSVSWAAPGIGNVPATIEWNAGIDFTNCTGPAVDQGHPTPVHLSEHGTELVSCDGDVSGHSGTGEITWSDGSASEMSAGVNVQSKSAGGGHGAFPITILTGNYAGHAATDDDTVTPSGQSCPGVTKATLTGTLSIF
ncbi:hypothetical protein [Nocardia aurantiaca]|uniref:Ig-like domain-containing protein n=1 Tax=Nocardia aurantiaca TaxID=2675850 RepID=A0A6I3L897_9NOCA|nr:hypothetical protein [Nocardia aurantiaca]MTE16665.1 hypothetical protein [Nocardia aurantiaca]